MSVDLIDQDLASATYTLVQEQCY